MPGSWKASNDYQTVWEVGMAGTYLLLGPEKGLKADYIKDLKAKLEPCEVSKFYEIEDNLYQKYPEYKKMIIILCLTV